MPSKYVVVVIAADGTTDVIGPYGSWGLASRDADAIRNESQGVSAGVHLMAPPSSIKKYATEGTA